MSLRRLRPRIALLALVAVATTVALVPGAIAADSGTIAFQGFRRGGEAQKAIFTMAANGDNVRRLANGEEPSISRDGKKIVFTRETGPGGQFREIFVMDSDGTDVRQLTRDSSDDSQPTFSPDGTEIAYVGNRAAEGPQIFLMTSSGSDPIQVTQGGPYSQANFEPSYSPNGKRLVFIHRGEHEAEIETMNIDGSDPAMIGNLGRFQDPSHPSYAPDGRRIVFQAKDKSGKVANVYTFEATKGSDLDKVNKGDAEAWEPAYSPNGRSIAFRRGINLFSMAPDGSGVDQLTKIDSQDGANTGPSWGR